MYDLPVSVTIANTVYNIRWDFRAALDIFEALNDPELEDDVRAFEASQIFYPEADAIPLEHMQEAVERCLWFLRGGKNADQKQNPKLIDWKQDFPLIVAPVNRVLGRDIREAGKPLHWWTFLAAFNEIGDCLFSQVVHVRSMRAKGKPLDKSDQEFYRENQDIIDLKQPLTDIEKDILSQWTGGKSEVSMSGG